MALLSFRQYAKRRGVSPEAVSKAVERGRISTVKGDNGKRLIDPVIADREWAANSSDGHKTTPTRGEREGTHAARDAQDAPGLAGPSYAQSRAIREAYAARLAKLEYEEKSGKLIPADKVKVDAFRLARTVRDAILNVPDRIANELASYDEPARIHERLTQELIQALEELVSNARRGV